MRREIEDHFLNPPPGSAAARAAEFGIDLTLTLENLRLTPEDRVRKLDNFIEGIAKLKKAIRLIDPGSQIFFGTSNPTHGSGWFIQIVSTRNLKS